jgi:hypothetical protein
VGDSETAALPLVERPGAAQVPSRQLTASTLLAFAPALGSCAAAALAPAVLAGSGIATAGERDIADQKSFPADTPPLNNSLPIAVPPSFSDAMSDKWQRFAETALTRSRAFGGPGPVPSALLVPFRAAEWPARRPCVAETAAVVVDLDEGATVFNPASDVNPAAGLADALARLREAGVVVLWVSQASANRVKEIGDALRASGLDPTGRDPLLLVRNPNERKQIIRTDAEQSVCVVAIAGDQRSDFDELFDYLRVPEYEAGLDHMLDDGWFLTSPPLSAVVSN